MTTGVAGVLRHMLIEDDELWVKGFTIMVNSLFNGWRMEDVWLDK